MFCLDRRNRVVQLLKTTSLNFWDRSRGLIMFESRPPPGEPPGQGQSQLDLKPVRWRHRRRSVRHRPRKVELYRRLYSSTFAAAPTSPSSKYLFYLIAVTSCSDRQTLASPTAASPDALRSCPGPAGHRVFGKRTRDVCGGRRRSTSWRLPDSQQTPNAFTIKHLQEGPRDCPKLCRESDTPPTQVGGAQSIDRVL
jgi:hypothetical protein